MVEKIEPFKDRLKTALEIRQLRAVDLCNKTKISQSTISQYLSGYAEPKKQRLQLIADKLNVNPSWLMGLDEPMENVQKPPQLEDVYLSFAKQAQDEEIPPEDIELAIKMIKELRGEK
jgi:transcriptional regulator with XRE-family HTH domain|uniref:Bifunctional HTH-domain containing protein/aminotransferase n=1 Tax=Siphoviridae sp. ctnNB1 TaxID=2825660 RepID=A0A8S5UV35_9CAUD|nr:MAG TPA: bifunctional HTH-domain containing protein/aminotransferase [Siphoviridae sp. ctnNB1]